MNPLNLHHKYNSTPVHLQWAPACHSTHNGSCLIILMMLEPSRQSSRRVAAHGCANCLICDSISEGKCMIIVKIVMLITMEIDRTIICKKVSIYEKRILNNTPNPHQSLSVSISPQDTRFSPNPEGWFYVVQCTRRGRPRQATFYTTEDDVSSSPRVRDTLH